MGVKDKVRTDLDLHKESILGMGCMLLKGLNPKVGVGQIWRQYLKKLKKNYAHIWKLKHCANADADADADANAWVTTKALQGHSWKDTFR